jgi:N-acetyl sugar amidotransferase
MKVCRRCLYTTMHPLGLVIDEEGICSGCRVHEEKDRMDWGARWRKLENIVESYRCKSGENYDCVVPVSGGRDSFFILHVVKKRLGLNPLLVAYNKHYNTAVGIRNLARLRTFMDCDIMTQVVDPSRVKRITRATFRRWGSIYWHCLAGQTVFPVQIAVKMKIPLIIWGHHQGLDQVGMFSHLHEVEMSRRHRRNHDLLRQEAEALVNDYDFVKPSDIHPYTYPGDEEIAAVGVRGIYLGNYIRWDTKAQHEAMLDLYDYEAVPQTRTFDTYNDLDCWIHSDLHDYVKMVKWGYGRATDHAVRELRFGRLTRDRAAKVAQEYEAKPPANIDLFLEWIGMSQNGFDFIIDQHRCKRIFERDGNYGPWRYSGKWRDAQIKAATNQSTQRATERKCSFLIRRSRPICDTGRKFILTGKGAYTAPDERSILTI